MGAVMGSKGIKAIVVLDPAGGENRPRHDPGALKDITKRWVTELFPMFEGLRTFGTANSVF